MSTILSVNHPSKPVQLAYPGRIDIAPDWQSIEINDQTFATLLELRRMGDISREQLIQATGVL